MNIDLFLTPHNEAGLVCGGVFANSVAGIILDAQTSEFTLEFSNGETFHLNIPMEEAHREKLLFSHRMFIGYLEDKMLADSYEVPLLYLNDPYGSDFGQTSALLKPIRSVPAFEQFMKRCSFAQALHRVNLGDETTSRSVLQGINPQKLDYTPALARQRQMEAVAVPVTQHTPQMGLGTRGGSVVSKQTSRRTGNSDTSDNRE
jgi:hypothetical protein